MEFVLLGEKVLQKAGASLLSIRKNIIGVLFLTFHDHEVVITMSGSNLYKTIKDHVNEIQSKANPSGC